jgi:hypothetical protein
MALKWSAATTDHPSRLGPPSGGVGSGGNHSRPLNGMEEPAPWCRGRSSPGTGPCSAYQAVSLLERLYDEIDTVEAARTSTSKAPAPSRGEGRPCQDQDLGRRRSGAWHPRRSVRRQIAGGSLDRSSVAARVGAVSYRLPRRLRPGCPPAAPLFPSLPSPSRSRLPPRCGFGRDPQRHERCLGVLVGSLPRSALRPDWPRGRCRFRRGCAPHDAETA